MSVAGGVDRRRYARQRIAALTYVELGNDNGGIVLNLGEGGLSMAVASPLVETAMPELRFRLPGSAEWIRVNAQIAWIGQSHKEAGLSFLKLAESDQARIREWLSAPEPPPAAPLFRALDRSLLDLPAPESEFEPELPPDPELTSDVDDAAHEVAAAEPPAPLPAAIPPTKEVSVEGLPAARERTRPSAREPWIRIELRLSRWLATVILVLFAVAVSFFAGVLAGRHSWAEQLRGFLRQAAAIGSSDGLKLKPGNAAGNDSPSLAQSNSPAPSSAEAQPPSSRGENGRAESGRAENTHANNEASALSRQSTGAAPSIPASAVPPPNLGAASPAPQLESSATAPPPAVSPVPPSVQSPIEPQYPATAPLAPAPATGTVEVLTDPYPSLRVPASAPAAPSGVPLRLGQLTTRVEPVYPPQALRDGIQGVVQLLILIGKDGSVVDTQVVRGPESLVRAVRDAVGRWHYQPTYLGSEPVETEADVTVTFMLVKPAPK